METSEQYRTPSRVCGGLSLILAVASLVSLFVWRGIHLSGLTMFLSLGGSLLGGIGVYAAVDGDKRGRSVAIAGVIASLALLLVWAILLYHELLKMFSSHH
jgi:hypothetical protein